MNIEKLYQDYLRKVKLPEDRMGETQRVETKRAFYAGITSFLSEVSSDESDQNLDRIVQDTYGQLEKFWDAQVAMSKP